MGYGVDVYLDVLSRLTLDHAWITRPLLSSLAGLHVVKETRSWDQPSDHVPVVVDLD